MDALEQGVEGKRRSLRHDDFAVEHEHFRLELADGFDQLGKIPRQRMTGLRLQLDLGAVAEHEAAKAIPFRLVLPVLALRNLIDGKRLHRARTADARQGA